MKRKAFLLTSLGALCAAATGKAAGLFGSTPKLNGSDKGGLIEQDRGIGYDGVRTKGVGVMFGRAKDGTVERYAVVFAREDTREGFVRKLRMLADAVETGNGAVLGENILTGNELNALEYEDRSPYANIEADRKATSYEPEDQKQWHICWSDKIANATPEEIAAARAEANAIRLAKRAAKGLA